MLEKIRKCVKDRISTEVKLEAEIGLVIALSLLTITVMSGYMDRFGEQNPDYQASTAAWSETAVGQDVKNACEGIIRFHVIANSDSEEDQELKLQVRNHVLAKVQNQIMSRMSREMQRNGQTELDEERQIEITRTYIQENLDQIEGWAADVIHAEGASYPVKATLGITWIPDREYDGIYFPAGNYEALNIVIGEGAGQNWWCVIFPPLCLIDCGEDLGEARMAAIGGDRILLKSRIVELLEQMK